MNNISSTNNTHVPTGGGSKILSMLQPKEICSKNKDKGPHLSTANERT